MADIKSTLENIVRECVKALGYDEVLRLVESAKPAVAAAPAPKKEKEKEPLDDKKKRIPRMTPTLANQLKAELAKVGLKIGDDDKKEFDKLKKEFTSYVDEMTDDDFTANGKGLTDHMREFANRKKPGGSAAAGNGDEKTVEKKKPAKKAAKTVEPPKDLAPPSNAAAIEDVSLKELQAITITASPTGEQTGVYWDADNGRWVRGPDADGDEDVEETKFEGKTYVVGLSSGRVYEETDNRDVFQGFVGVGRFKTMKMPKA
jgi:hypothetical protein